MWSIILSLTRQLIFLVPLLAILPKHFGIDGVWGSMAASDFLAFAMAVIVMIFNTIHFNRLYRAGTLTQVIHHRSSPNNNTDTDNAQTSNPTH